VLRVVAAVLLISGLRAQPTGFVGPEACAPCHQAEYEKQTRSRHAKALRPIVDSPIAAAFKQVRDGPSTVEYERVGEGVRVSVSEAGKRIHAVLLWAFGAGAQGVTPVGIYEGRFFEHRYSYYSAVRGYAVTFGHPQKASGAAAELGVAQDGKTILQCFNCHATGVPASAVPDVSAIIPGVTCERCHGPGAAHVRAAKEGAPVDEVRKTLVNPGRFPARAQVEICGECHRLPGPDDGPEPEIENPVSVRFAPVGLMASRCFQQSKRLSCATCHDPHDNAEARSAARYTDTCLDCHSAAPHATSACPRTTDRRCVSCHMPESKLGAYLRFTDHRIRVDR
jgi:hypothetical protein